jgi:hypothetical protein
MQTGTRVREATLVASGARLLGLVPHDRQRDIAVRLVSGEPGDERVSASYRHFPDRAHRHGSQAWPEGEGLLSRVHDKADDEVIAEPLC